MTTPVAVGVDAGVTNTAMAWINRTGHSEMLRDREGNRFLPSLVFFDDQKFSVGEEARLRGSRKMDYVGRMAKLALGRSLHALPIRGEYFPPEVIHACLLHHVHRELETRFQGHYRAVLTAPAFFGELRRKAVADAAEMAGLQVIELLNEPTAAALAFGEHTGYLSQAGAPLQHLRVLVYNLNGFTFETTLLDLSQAGVHTLAVDGDLALGGFCWDERLADCAAELFIRKYGIDPRDNPHSQQQLLARVQHAKHSLGMRQSAHFPLQCEGKTLEVTLTRDEFHHATDDLLERTVEIVQGMLSNAGLDWPLVDRILLTGGATQMPVVQNRLRELSGQDPDCTVHPNEAVARGAALYAKYLLERNSVSAAASKFQINHVATRALGIQSVDAKTGKKFNKVLIPRGSHLPAKATEKFIVHPERTKDVVITILEGEHDEASQCQIVGRAVIKDVPQDLSDEWPVIVTFEHTASGRLQVEARLCYTDRAVRLDLTHTVGLSAAQRRRWRDLIKVQAPFADLQDELHRKRSIPIAYATSSPLELPQEPAVEASDKLLDRARVWLQRLSPLTDHDARAAPPAASPPG